MARTTNKPQAAPAGDVGSHAPTFTFEPFKWVPDDFPHNAMVHARELSRLVNHVRDVASGAATVLQLMLAHEEEIDQDNETYLSPRAIEALQQLAIRALESLDSQADSVADRLRDLEDGRT